MLIKNLALLKGLSSHRVSTEVLEQKSLDVLQCQQSEAAV